MKRLLFSLLLSFVATSWVKGQSDVPPNPRVKSVQGPMMWTLDYKYSGPNPYLKPPTPDDTYIYARLESENPRYVSTKVIKSGDRRLDVTVFDDNTQTVVCVIGDLVMTKKRLLPYIEARKISQGLDRNIGDDFGSLAWVNKAEYKGHQDFQGTTCCVYYVHPDRELSARTAYIDAKTGLPSGVVINDLTITYSFSPTDQAVELPPEFVGRLKKYQDDQKLIGPGGQNL